MNSPNPLLVLVGGFLGSGKTRLLLRAAEILTAQGLRCAAITNDQANDLVDTKWWQSAGDHPVEEIGDGCFCCCFDEFANAAERLRSYGPDVIFAEPVGSCTDIAATVIRPMQSLYGSAFEIAPYTVLIDPLRIRKLLEAGTDISYLVHKQVEEADILCYSKADLSVMPAIENFPVGRTLSSKTGEGVHAWLHEVSSGQLTVGTRLLELDYERYARAEASLAWLNAAIHLESPTGLMPLAVVGPFFDELQSRLTAESITIAHLKLLDRTPSSSLKIAVCANGAEPEAEGDRLGSPEQSHRLTLNLRAEGDPEKLRDVVDDVVGQLPPAARVLNIVSFRPAAPNPQHRFF